MPVPEPRKGMPDPSLDESEFKSRFHSQFKDPAFDAAQPTSWTASRAPPGTPTAITARAPRTRKAGPGYADPDYDLAVDWIAAREAILDARSAGTTTRLARRASCWSTAPSRSEHTCPGEMSKTWRLVEIAREVLERRRHRGRASSTSAGSPPSTGGTSIPARPASRPRPPLCHWPCSCYPNYSLGQTQDWMNDIYPMWVAAHGVMIVTPVNWYQVVLAAEADDGPAGLRRRRQSRPDADPRQGRREGQGSSSSRAGTIRATSPGGVFSVVVHGDVEGAENVRRSVSDWLRFMQPAAGRRHGRARPLHRLLEALRHQPRGAGRDEAVQEEVRNAAATLVTAVRRVKAGEIRPEETAEPRPK